MTTKPKARKFRIRRAAPLTTGHSAPHPVDYVAAPPQTGQEGAHSAEPATPLSAPPRPQGMGHPRAQTAAEDTAQTTSQASMQTPAASNTAPIANDANTAAPQPSAKSGTAAQAAAAQNAPAAEQDGKASAAREGDVASAREQNVSLDIDEIRKEGLTGRQLRMARRVAQKNGLAPTSDFDAVRLLRAKGIDPFQRANMLELVVPQDGSHPDAQGPLPGMGDDGGGVPPAGAAGLPATQPARNHLPQAMSPGQNLPAADMSPADRRALEIAQIQRDLAKRRRRKSALLLARLSAFVFLPTLLAGYYFFAVATPMYSAKSEFLILQADNQGGGGLGGLLSGTQFATSQDSIAVQSYLQSKDAMLRLDGDVQFRGHFQQGFIDPIQRLDPDASIEDAYKIFKKNIKIGYDPTEGVLRMEVTASEPDVAATFSEHLIRYAEERVDDLSRRKREDGMATAAESLTRAKEERRAAQAALVQLQEGTFIDPEGIITALRGQINNVEIQLQEKELQLAAMLDNARPNSAKVEGARGDVRRLQALLDELRRKMTDATTGESSLAEKAAQIQMAQADLATADLFLQSALQNEKQTALEANRQVRYLTTSVRPVPPEDPSYPKGFENTVLAFLIFSGIYLMVSLTSSILREQVSS